ncbi:MAG TPA: hypothetical protein VGH89_13955 [Pseudonocardia sp.]|jgi:hypothetical protein
MTTFKALAPKAAAVAAALCTGLLLPMGAAGASTGTAHPNLSPRYLGYDHHDPIVIGGPREHRTHNSTTTKVHSSGSGGTAVTAAGSNSRASQYVDQSKTDKGKTTHYRDNSRTIREREENAHNRVDYRDSHDRTDIHHR